MKIILTCHQFLPEYTAGTEVLTLDTARALRALGHEVSIFTSGPPKEDGGRCFDYVYDDFEVRRYVARTVNRSRPYDTARWDYEDQTLGVLFEGYLLEKKPDVVHFFHLMRLTGSAVHAAQRLRIATVFTPTDFWAICPTNQLRLPNQKICAGPDADAANCVAHTLRSIRPLRKIRFITQLPTPLLRLALKFMAAIRPRRWRVAANLRSMQNRLLALRETISGVGRIVAPSKVMLDLFLRYGYPAQKMTLSRYGLVGATSYPAHQPRQPDGSLVVGFIGTLSKHKGAHVLIKAATLLPPSTAFTLRIYGSELDDPRYCQELHKLAAGDPRIVFVGPFPNDKIGLVLSGIDVLCVPSIWLENIPLVLLSAHAAGVPVIATDLGGMSEAIEHEVNGFLFPVGKHRALATIIEKITQDPDLLARVTNNVRPPKDIADYGLECEAQYKAVIAEMAGA